MGLSDFLDYCASNTDEQPLYLFDKKALVGEMAQEFTVPDYFAPSRDLFTSLPAPYRPDHRWLIIGGTRSGSSWHVDPNATSAWNACVKGRKRWILTPPEKPPPGVTASADGVDVTSPISLYEWFRVFYSSLAQARCDAPRGEVVALEATVEAGEVLFVPSGWWHCCLNLAPSIAITQNYAPRCHARSVLAYLRAGERAGDLVSGVPLEVRPRMAAAFEAVLREHCPEALEAEPAAAEAAEPEAAAADAEPPPPQLDAAGKSRVRAIEGRGRRSAGHHGQRRGAGRRLPLLVWMRESSLCSMLSSSGVRASPWHGPWALGMALGSCSGLGNLACHCALATIYVKRLFWSETE